MQVLSIEQTENVEGAIAPIVVVGAVAVAGIAGVLYGASQGYSCSFTFGSGFSFSCNS